MLRSKPLRSKERRNEIPAEEGLEQDRRETIRKDAFFTVVIDSFASLFKSNPAQAAASISYYSLFSLFPFILFMVVGLSYFLEFTVIQHEIVSILEKIFPGAEKIVIENLQNILAKRATTSITASITLLWSGSGAFNCVISNVHRAWPESNGRGYFVNRAFAISGIIAIILVLASSLVLSVMFNISDVLSVFTFQISHFLMILFSIFINYIVPIVLIYYAAYLLFRYVPAVAVDRRAAQIGAALTSLTWRVFTSLFALFLLSPLNTYDLIYGSVAVLILILLYIYFSALIILYSAHLVAAITHYKIKQGLFTDKKPQNLNPLEKESGIIPRIIRKTRQSFSQGWQKLSQFAAQKISQITANKPNLKTHMIKIKENHNLRNTMIVIRDFIKSLFRWK